MIKLSYMNLKPFLIYVDIFLSRKTKNLIIVMKNTLIAKFKIKDKENVKVFLVWKSNMTEKHLMFKIKLTEVY